jgi:protease-4
LGVDEVFAEPTTITGSIGVFAIIPTFENTLKKLGIGADGVKATPYSGEPNVLEGLSPQTGMILQASVEDIYRRFTGLVAAARKIPVQRVDEIGQGRVWDGGSARQFGLVTAFGGLDDAVAAAAKRAGLEAAKVRTVDIEKTPAFPLAILESMFAPEEQAPAPSGDAIARAAHLAQLRAAASVAEAVRLAGSPSVQARCVACGAYAAPSFSATDAETLKKLALTAR